MSTQATGPNRLSRIAAKEVPHRKTDRFFAAKADLKTSCENLIKEVELAKPLHDPMRHDLVLAARRVEREAHDLGPDDSGARSTIVDLEKQVEHLALALKWVVAAQRVLDRLGDNHKAVRDNLLEVQDAAMWHVRAEVWDGQLTTAVSQLKSVVQEAEAEASRA